MSFTLKQFSQIDGKTIPRKTGDNIFPAPTQTTFELFPDQPIDGVKFWWNSEALRPERSAPWRVNGDKGILKFKALNTLRAVASLKGKVKLDYTWKFTCKDIPKPPDGIVQKLGTKGLVCYASDDVKAVAQVAADMGITAVRWWGGTDFKKPSSEAASRAVEWKAKTPIKRITLTLTPGVESGYIPPLSDVREFANAARDLYVGKIDALQIINECNLKPRYWGGSIQQAADVCNVFVEVLAGSGIDVIAPSISRNVTALENLVACGLKVQRYAFHSYGMNADAHINGDKGHKDNRGVVGAAKAVGDVPLQSTEHGMHCGSFTGWRVEMPKAWEGIKPYICEADIYRFIANTQPAGRFGMMLDKDAPKPNAETYAVWKGLKV